MLALLSVAGQPRLAKRIDVLQQMGCTVSAGLFRRARERGRMPQCELTELGRIDDFRYLARIPTLWRARAKVRRLAESADVVYAFGPDMALLAACATRKPIVMEIGDVVPMQVRGDPIGAAYRRFDRWIARRCDLIVTTTPRFLSQYFRGWLGVQTPGIVLENKVEARWAESVRSAPDQPHRRRTPGDPVRIGYFGLLGCQWAMDTFHELARAEPGRFEFVVAGKEWPGADLKRLLATTPGTEYRGPYRSPEDLPGLYGSVDMTWACYPPIAPGDWNLKWARPNRFYESCLFRVPLISRAGSSDAEDVTRLGIGAVLDRTDPKEAAQQLAGMISDEAIAGWTESMGRVPRSVYSYTDEFDRLMSAISALAGRSSASSVPAPH